MIAEKSKEMQLIDIPEVRKYLGEAVSIALRVNRLRGVDPVLLQRVDCFVSKLDDLRHRHGV